MTDFALTTTPRSAADVDALRTGANATPYINLITAREFEGWIRAEQITFAYADSQIAGFGAWLRIDPAWIELGPYFISPDFQGQGLGRVLFNATLEATAGMNRYGVSKNDAMKRLFTRTSFTETPFAALPASVRWWVLRKLSPAKFPAMLRKYSSEPVSHYVLKA
jgi:GNAT superfamily N-acetyltransferase